MVEETKPQETKPPAAQGLEAPEEFSLADLDKVLGETDPDFQKSLDSFKTDLADSAKTIVELNVTNEEDQDKEVDIESLPPAKKILYKILFPLKKPWGKLKALMGQKWIAAKNLSTLWMQQMWRFFFYELPERIRYVKSIISLILMQLVSLWRTFKDLSFARQVATVLIAASICSSLYFAAKIFVPRWLPMFSIDILSSWAKDGKVLGTVRGKEELINFFDAYPERYYPVRLTKVVVNLKRDGKSGANPMGLFEFFLALDSKNTAVEVRDREKEILDLVQRNLEEFTYPEIMSEGGKVRMKAAIREGINSILNQGTVREIYINRMITYH